MSLSSKSFGELSPAQIAQCFSFKKSLLQRHIQLPEAVPGVFMRQSPLETEDVLERNNSCVGDGRKGKIDKV